MSNRPVKKNKVVEITQEDFEVEWTPPPRTARDRIIQVGVIILIIAFLLPVVTCAATSSPAAAPDAQEQAQQQDEVEMSIQQYAKQLAANPKDATVLANLGYYTNQKAARMVPDEKSKNERMTLLVTAEKYLRDALAEDENYAFAQTELIKNLLLQEKLEDAEGLITKANANIEKNLKSSDEKVAADAKSQKVQLALMSAELERGKGNMEAALEQINQAIELKPGEPQLYLARAELHRTNGDKDKAKADYATVVDIGQKTGNQQAVMIGQIMIEQIDAPAVPASSATPGPAGATPAPVPAAVTPGAAPTPAPRAVPTPAVTP